MTSFAGQRPEPAILADRSKPHSATALDRAPPDLQPVRGDRWSGAVGNDRCTYTTSGLRPGAGADRTRGPFAVAARRRRSRHPASTLAWAVSTARATTSRRLSPWAKLRRALPTSSHGGARPRRRCLAGQVRHAEPSADGSCLQRRTLGGTRHAHDDNIATNTYQGNSGGGAALSQVLTAAARRARSIPAPSFESTSRASSGSAAVERPRRLREL